MKVSTQQLPERQVLLEIEVDPEQLEKSMDRAYRKLVQRIDVPGFRKGKTPRNMLERHVGRGRILEEAIDIAVPEAYNKALEDHDIDAIGQPQIELTSAEPLSFKATVPIRPTVELGDYKSIRVRREPVEVDEKDVEQTVDELRRRYAVHEPVERTVKVNDIIRADVRIVVDENEVYKDDDVELHLREGKTVLLPGFVEGVAGAKKGKPQQVPVTIPENSNGPLAGKTANVDITVKEVKEERLPDPDDDFAQQVGEGFAGMDALRDRLRGDIRERAQSVAEDKYREDALTALVQNAGTIEFPPVLVDREIDHFLHDQARNSGMELERYLKLVGKTPDTIREELTPGATERVKRSLALSRLAEDEKIEVEDSDIDAEIDSMVAQASAGNDEQAQQYRQIFQSPEARTSLGRSLLTRKTMERLVEIAGQADGAKPSAKKSQSSGKKKTKAGSTSGKGKEE